MDIKTSAWIFYGSFLASALIIFFFRLFKNKANFKFCGVSLFLTVALPILTAVFSVNEIIWPRPFYASMCFGMGVILGAFGIVISLAPAIRNYHDRRIVVGMFIFASALNAIGETIRYFFPNAGYLSLQQLLSIMENVISFSIIMLVIASMTYMNFLFSAATWDKNQK